MEINTQVHLNLGKGKEKVFISTIMEIDIKENLSKILNKEMVNY